MRYFWHGFQKTSNASVQFKKHVIILFWSPEEDKSVAGKRNFRRLASMYPTVKVKLVNISKSHTRPLKHNVLKTPTILLLKDGKEIDRLNEVDNRTLVEQLFRKAQT